MGSYEQTIEPASAKGIIETRPLPNHVQSRADQYDSPETRSTNQQTRSAKQAWIRRRFWTAIVAYWIISGAGAAAIELAGIPTGHGWLILVMLAFVGLCMATGRGGWKGWQRVAFFLISPIVRSLLELPFFLMIGRGLYVSGNGDLIDPVVYFCGTMPVLFVAMRQSRLFVTLVEKPARPR